MKFRSRSLINFCLSSGLLLFWLPQQAAASMATAEVAATIQANLEIPLPAIAPPELPPLGEPDLYLPEEALPTRLVIKLSQRRVYVYEGDLLQTSYPIAIGREGWETPVGYYEVRKMIRHPSWQHPWTGEVVPPGPENPLGTRWISFWTDGRNEIGFHGTPDEKLIGQAVSHGCIRMRDRDVRALFERVNIGTPVTVQP